MPYFRVALGFWLWQCIMIFTHISLYIALHSRQNLISVPFFNRTTHHSLSRARHLQPEAC